MTAQGASALRVLAAEYEAAIQATEAYQGTEEELERVVDKECAIARRIALLPAMTLTDLAIKAVVALRETGTNKFKIGEPVDCDAASNVRRRRAAGPRRAHQRLDRTRHRAALRKGNQHDHRCLWMLACIKAYLMALGVGQEVAG